MGSKRRVTQHMHTVSETAAFSFSQAVGLLSAQSSGASRTRSSSRISKTTTIRGPYAGTKRSLSGQWNEPSQSVREE